MTGAYRKQRDDRGALAQMTSLAAHAPTSARQKATGAAADEVRYLSQWASQKGIAPILTRDDVPAAVAPGYDKTWCLTRMVLPLTDGSILAVSKSRLFEAIDELKRNNYTVKHTLPTARHVFDGLLEDVAQVTKVKQGAVTDVETFCIDLLREAIAEGASDIHIEVKVKATIVRFRVNGVLKKRRTVSRAQGLETIRFLFNFVNHGGSKDIYNIREPADGISHINVGGQQVAARLSSVPTHPKDGECVDVVLRVPCGHGALGTIEALGYRADQVRIFHAAIAQPHGMLLIAGPTGSGKTTTLACLMQLFPDTEKTITIEDPVEYALEGCTQVPANTEHDNLGFPAMTRQSMRHDPDNIMIGEIRDEDTARQAMRAAITGHFVSSTIHTKSATSIVTRLGDFGIDLNLQADPGLLVCLVYQILLPTVCPLCSTPLPQARAVLQKERPGLLKRIDAAIPGASKIRVKNAKGCRHCRGTGISGRTVAAEVIYLDDKSREFISKGNLAGWEEYLKSQGWKPVRAHVVEKVRDGIVSPDDAELHVTSLCDVGTGFNYATSLDLLGGD